MTVAKDCDQYTFCVKYIFLESVNHRMVTGGMVAFYKCFTLITVLALKFDSTQNPLLLHHVTCQEQAQCAARMKIIAHIKIPTVQKHRYCIT